MNSSISGGILTLANSNNYVGTTTINGGTLSVATIADSGPSSIGGSGNALSIGNGVFQFTGGSATTSRNVTITSGTSTIDLPNGASLNLAGATTGGPGLYLYQTNQGLLTLSGTADNSGLRLIVSSGTAVLAKSTDLTHHAVADIYGVGPGALLQMGNAGSGVYQIFPQGIVTGMNGTMDFNGQSETFDTLSGSGTVTNTGFASTSTMTLGYNNGSSTFNGVIQNGLPSGLMALTKIGTGTFTLAGINSYSGTTSINGGVLSLANTGALAGGGLISFGGGTLQFSSNNTVDYSNFITSSGSTISIDTNGQNVIFNNTLSSSNSGGLTVISSASGGTLTLGGANNYMGTTSINGGLLSLANAAAIPSGGNLTFGGGTLQFGAANTSLPNTIAGSERRDFR